MNPFHGAKTHPITPGCELPPARLYMQDRLWGWFEIPTDLTELLEFTTAYPSLTSPMAYTSIFVRTSYVPLNRLDLLKAIVCTLSNNADRSFVGARIAWGRPAINVAASVRLSVSFPIGVVTRTMSQATKGLDED